MYRPQLADKYPHKDKNTDDDSSDDDIIEIVSRTALQSSSKKRSREGEDGDDDDDESGLSKEERKAQREESKRKARRLLMFGEGAVDVKPDVKPQISNSKSAKQPMTVAERLAAMRAIAAAAQVSNDATRSQILVARAEVAQRTVAAENAAAAAAASSAAESAAAAAASGSGAAAPRHSAPGSSQAIDPTSTVLVQLRHVAGDESVFPSTDVRMPVGTALRKLLKRLVKSLRKAGSLPAHCEADDLVLRYDGAVVSMSHTLLSVDSDAVEDWLADASCQDEPACILDVAVSTPEHPPLVSPLASDAPRDAPVPGAAAAAPAPPPLRPLHRPPLQPLHPPPLRPPLSRQRRRGAITATKAAQQRTHSCPQQRWCDFAVARARPLTSRTLCAASAVS